MFKKRNLKNIYSRIISKTLGNYSPFVLRATIEPTLRCNLNCKMCPFWRTDIKGENQETAIQMMAREISLEEQKYVVDQLKNMRCREISITGGEPFIRRDVGELVKYIKSKGINCLITTNGTLINDSDAKNIVSCGLDTLSVSVDGPKKLHNSIRGGEDTYQKVKENIQKVINEKELQGKEKPKIYITATISNMNINKLSKMVDVTKNLNCEHLQFNHLEFTNNEKVQQTKDMVMRETDGIEYTAICKNFAVPKEIIEGIGKKFEKQYLKIFEKGKKEGVSIRFLPDNLSPEEARKYYGDYSYPIGKKCNYPFYEVRISPYGEVFVCNMDFKIGNVKKNSIKSLWNCKAIKDFRVLLNKGMYLPFCPKCCKLR